MIKKAAIVGCLLLCATMSFATIITPPWLKEAEEREPELARLLGRALAEEPQPEVFNGRPLSAYYEGLASFRRQFGESLGSTSTDMVHGKLAAAFSATPPDWPVVGLALRAAYYTKLTPRVLDIAQEIVDNVPPVDYGAELANRAMRVLVYSHEQRYVDFVFQFLNKGEFKKAKTDTEREALISCGVAYLTQLPLTEAREYLKRLSLTYPDTAQGNQGDQPSDCGMSKRVADELRYMESHQEGAKIHIDGKTPRP